MCSFLAFIAKLLLLLNFLTLSNDQNLAKPRHRPFEQSLFFFLTVAFLLKSRSFGCGTFVLIIAMT